MEKTIRKTGLKNLFLFVVPYLFVVGLAQYTGAYLSGIEDFGYESPTLFQTLIVSFFGFIGTFSIIYLFMYYVEKKPFASLGFDLTKKHNYTFSGVFLGLLTMLIGMFTLLLLEEIEIVSSDFIIKKFLLSIVLFVIISITEETLFRGYVLRNLMDSLNDYSALLLSSVLFVLMHALNPEISIIGVVNLFLAGVLLGLPYIYTKNLWFSVALHFSWNFFQSILGFNVSGQNSYSIFEIEFMESNIINGGKFGLEGSVLIVVIQIMAILLIYAYFTRWNSRKDRILK